MGERTPLAVVDCAGLGPHGGGRGDHQPAGRADRAGPRQAQLQLDGRLRRARRRRGAVRHRRRRSAWSSARRSASACRSARTRCRCARAGAMAAQTKQVTAPVSLIVTAFATLDDVRGTLTPQLQPGDTHADPDRPRPGRKRMGGSMLAQVLGQLRRCVPDLDDAQTAEVAGRRGQPLRAAGPAARLPRPQRRRPVGHGVRDGLRRPAWA